MKATLKHHRQQPRKTRLIADLVRGKTISEALNVLAHTNKRGAPALKKLIESAAANAKQKEGLDRGELIISEIQVGKGVTFRRFMPRARGRATPIHKRTSHISIALKPVGNIK